MTQEKNPDIRWEDYRNLIFKLARKYERAGREIGLDMDDILQHSAIGFYNAKRRFDPDKGQTFLTFAYAVIQNEIVNGFDVWNRDRRVQRRAKPLIKKIRQDDWAPDQLTAEAVSDYYGASIKLTREAVRVLSIRSNMYLSIADEDENAASMFDHYLKDADDETQLFVENFLSRLSVEEQIIVCKLLEGYSQTEISQQMQVSRQAVSQRIKRIQKTYQRMNGGSI